MLMPVCVENQYAFCFIPNAIWSNQGWHTPGQSNISTMGKIETIYEAKGLTLAEAASGEQRLEHGHLNINNFVCLPTDYWNP